MKTQPDTVQTLETFLLVSCVYHREAITFQYINADTCIQAYQVVDHFSIHIAITAGMYECKHHVSRKRSSHIERYVQTKGSSQKTCTMEKLTRHHPLQS